VLIGRYARFNSWDLGVRPERVVLDSLAWASPRALVGVVLLAGGLAVVTTTMRGAARRGARCPARPRGRRGAALSHAATVGG
jgi:hypothetical protein